MKDKLSGHEARDVVAARIVETVKKNGGKVTFEEAQRRVGSAMVRGDQQRKNGNR